jgi:hypothetical protein
MRSGPRHAVRQPGGSRHVRRYDRGDWPPTSGRRWRRTTLTAVGLVLVLIGALALSAKAVNLPPPEPASAPALLGAGAWADSGTAATQQAATRRLETAIGRTLNIRQPGRRPYPVDLLRQDQPPARGRRRPP